MSTYVITYPKGFDEPGGGTKSFLQISQNLQKLGVKIITVPVSNLSDGGVPDHSITVNCAKPNKIHYLLNGLSVAKTVKDILKQHQVDAVISWEHEAAFMSDYLRANNIVFGMIAAHPSYQIRVERENSWNPLKKFLNSWLRWRSLKVADLVFVSSNFTKNELMKLFRINQEKIVMTHRGIADIFSHVERRESVTEINNFIFYGSLAPIKGVYDVIKAVGQLYQQGYRSWQLKIAGWGDEVSLQKAIAEQGIGNNVKYVGSLNQEQLLTELAWADVAILPSRAESFGRAIAEAQAAGLPVVAYQAGSVPEIVKDGVTGWLAPPERFDLLANALMEAIDNPERTIKMGLLGRERISELFTWEKTASAIHKGIQNCLSQPPN